MPNKVAGYYTTDHKPRHLAISSDYIKSVRYDKETMCLYVIFYNDQEYKYYQVPEEFYTGMLKAGSHGTHFYHTIRQSFSFDLLDEDGNVIRSGGPSKPTGTSTLNFKDKPILTPSISNKAVPELAKLDALDVQEAQLNKELNKRIITQEQFNSVTTVIKNKRDKLIKKLEKDGYFPKEDIEYNQDEVVSELENQQLNKAINQAVNLERWARVKNKVVAGLLVVGVIAGYNSPGLAFIVCMFAFCYFYHDRK
jgi:hypothetical protein